MAAIDHIQANAYKIPTDAPEADGTFQWRSTTIVIVQVSAEGRTGIGWTYNHAAVVPLIEDFLKPILQGQDAFEIPALWNGMVEQVRNIGKPGLVSSAISAVEVALWDLKAKLMRLPLCELWGKTRQAVPVYGSGGFTSYSRDQLAHQFQGWAEQGISQFKMKVGADPGKDMERVKHAREVIGPGAGLFVDANGAYTVKQALEFAQRFKEHGVEWLEEPVSSDDLEGLSRIRQRAPAGLDIAAGEYGYDADYFRRMLEAGSVDVLQADATRCGGFMGFFEAAGLSRAFHTPLSSHTAPFLHLHACLCISHVVHMEYFHDHVRIERMFFEGVPAVRNGFLAPGLGEGLGLKLKDKDMEPYLIKDLEHVYG